MLVLDLPKKLIDSAFPAVERHLARRPDGWLWVGGRGKLRRYAGDRGGLGDLERAADTYLDVFGQSHPDLLIPINLYRLAGSDRAAPLLDRLRSELSEEIAQEGHDVVRTGSLLEACFLQGDDEQAQAVLASMPEPGRRGLAGTRYPAVAELAAARAAADLSACDEALGYFDRLVARAPASFSDAGSANAYDWLEIALVTRSEIAGEVSPRLSEL